ncbi:MAG: SRPBCC family protein [Actinomycetota bacterium]
MTRREDFESVRQREVGAPRERVLATIRDASTWPIWQPEIEATEGSEELSPGDAVLGTADMLGFVVHGRSTVVAVDECSFDEDVIVGVRMRIRFEVSERDGVTVIKHRLTAVMPRGPMGKILSFFLRKRLVRMQETALRQLADQVVGPSL